MLKSSRGSLVHTVFGAVLVGGIGLYACSDASLQSVDPGELPVGPPVEQPVGQMPEEMIPVTDGGIPDAAGPPRIPDLAMPGAPMEIQGTEPVVPADYWPLGVDLGETDPTETFRALLVLQLRNPGELITRIDSLYAPGSAQFRKYLTVADFMSSHAPTASTVDDVKSWLVSKGFKIDRTAKNRLFINYSGTVAKFNAAFNTKLHTVRRTDTTWRDPAYAPLTEVTVPQALIGKIKRVLMPDRALYDGTLSPDTYPVDKTPPAGVATKLSPAQIVKAYGISDLYAQGIKGAGMTIGVVGCTLFRNSDAQSMWQTFGINRANPVVIETMEPSITRDLETTLDIQLAGAIAPEAEVVFYGGPNNSDTSLLYTFNEAITDNRAQVLSDSFAHAEGSTPDSVSRSYNESAMMAASLGITIVSAAGNSNQVDVPANSPYVTSVGGTNIELNADNTWKSEKSWEYTGCGRSGVFTRPAWQVGEYSNAVGRRTVTDVSTVVGPYWVKYLAKWTYADGTSAATPVFGGILTLINQYRKTQGKPQVGFVNSLLYKHPASRAAFRDITVKGEGGCDPSTGYDLATGIGTPKVPELARAIP